MFPDRIWPYGDPNLNHSGTKLGPLAAEVAAAASGKAGRREMLVLEAAVGIDPRIGPSPLAYAERAYHGSETFVPCWMSLSAG